MADQKLRCALAYRIDPGSTVLLAKYDHAAQHESSSQGESDRSDLYGGSGKNYADAVAAAIEIDPPAGLAESGQIGGFKVVQSDQHQVVYGADADRVCLAVITGLSYPSHVSMQMLQELYGEFNSKYGSEAATAGTNAFSKRAKTLLKDTCAKYDDLQRVDKTVAVNGKVDEAKRIMESNIARALENNEQADTLAEKSDQLVEQAVVFQKRSTALRKQLAWKNFKVTILLFGIVIVILIATIVPRVLKK